MQENITELIRKGTDFLSQADFEQALSFFDQALILDPNNPDLLNKKGITLRGLGRYDEALECFNKSLQIDPRDLKSS